MKIDWWRACWRSKSGPGKGNKTSQRQPSSRSNNNRAGGRVTAWRVKQDRVRHGYCVAHGALRAFSPRSPEGERERKDKIARLEALSLASSLENDVMLLTEKMFAAFY